MINKAAINIPIAILNKDFKINYSLIIEQTRAIDMYLEQS